MLKHQDNPNNHDPETPRSVDMLRERGLWPVQHDQSVDELLQKFPCKDVLALIGARAPAYMKCPMIASDHYVQWVKSAVDGLCLDCAVSNPHAKTYTCSKHPDLSEAPRAPHYPGMWETISAVARTFRTTV